MGSGPLGSAAAAAPGSAIAGLLAALMTGNPAAGAAVGGLTEASSTLAGGQGQPPAMMPMRQPGPSAQQSYPVNFSSAPPPTPPAPLTPAPVMAPSGPTQQLPSVSGQLQASSPGGVGGIPASLSKMPMQAPPSPIQQLQLQRILAMLEQAQKMGQA